MNGAKPWQIALIAVGLLAGVGGIVWAISSMGPLETATSVILADLSTGELFEANTAGRTVVIPMKNPITGERLLFPVAKTEDGQWKVSDRYFSSFLQRVDEKTSSATDRSSGIIQTTGEPKRIR